MPVEQSKSKEEIRLGPGFRGKGGGSTFAKRSGSEKPVEMETSKMGECGVCVASAKEGGKKHRGVV